jgi:hypothetical protein
VIAKGYYSDGEDHTSEITRKRVRHEPHKELLFGIPKDAVVPHHALLPRISLVSRSVCAEVWISPGYWIVYCGMPDGASRRSWYNRSLLLVP